MWRLSANKCGVAAWFEEESGRGASRRIPSWIRDGSDLGLLTDVGERSRQTAITELPVLDSATVDASAHHSTGVDRIRLQATDPALFVFGVPINAWSDVFRD